MKLRAGKLSASIPSAPSEVPAVAAPATISPAAGCGVSGDPAPATQTDAHESPAAGVSQPRTRLGRPTLLVLSLIHI